MITGEQDEIGNKEVLDPQWFGVQGDCAEELASGTTTSPCPVYEGARVCEYGTTVPPPRYQPSKADDGAGLPDSLASPWLIDHTSRLSKNRSKQTDRGCRASHTYFFNYII